MCWPGGVSTIHCQVRKARHLESCVRPFLCAATSRYDTACRKPAEVPLGRVPGGLRMRGGRVTYF